MKQARERPKVVSLFSGVGGLDLGLEMAGFDTVAMVEADGLCVASLRANQERVVQSPSGPIRAFHGARIVHARIETVDAESLRGEGVALLAGGPPCQPFSPAGKLRSLEDPRGNLFRQFVRIADALKPPLILLENVQGLVTAKGPKGIPGEVLALVRAEFESLGYGVRVAVLNAADYGVPQRRVRFFLIAARHGELPAFPEPTHARAASEPSLFSAKPWVGIREAIGGMPDPDDSEVDRPKPELEARLLELTPGTGLKTGAIVEANRPGGHWGYRQDCFVADTSIPSRTIRTLPSPDWIYDRSGRLRRLTWRECTVLQGFPGDWEFVGSRSGKFKQIGNAVPPPLAFHLGRVLREAAESLDKNAPAPRSAETPRNLVQAIKKTISENRVNQESRANPVWL